MNLREYNPDNFETDEDVLLYAGQLNDPWVDRLVGIASKYKDKYEKHVKAEVMEKRAELGPDNSTLVDYIVDFDDTELVQGILEDTLRKGDTSQ